MADLWATDNSLAAGLQALLSFEEGTGLVEEIFGVTFTASANPLLGNTLREQRAPPQSVKVDDDYNIGYRSMSAAEEHKEEETTTATSSSSTTTTTAKTADTPATPPAYVQLCEGGADLPVSRSNRHLFVKSFITHALYDSAAGEVDLYIEGLKTFLHPNTLAMCSAAEVRHK